MPTGFNTEGTPTDFLLFEVVCGYVNAYDTQPPLAYVADQLGCTEKEARTYRSKMWKHVKKVDDGIYEVKVNHNPYPDPYKA